jgi:copper chaperone NosL
MFGIEKGRGLVEERMRSQESGMKQKGVFLVWAMAFYMLTGMVALVQAQEDIQKQSSCKYCGMDRQQFAQSRMFIEYDDGSSVGTCSIHCTAIDLSLNIDKTPAAILVGDYNTKQLIDAEKAYWVLGGNKPGVMTKTAKWAFAKQEDADKFIQEQGGRVATFDDAMKASYEDMYADTKMIRAKRAMKKTQPMEHKHN